MATIAYGSITILDLIDTATYIYYSENENGAGATKAPNANTKYIGIYSDPPVEGGQPDTDTEEYNSIKDKIVWSKYTGEKGDKGDSITITSTSIQYAVSKNGTTAPSTGWETFVPTLNGGEYLWTKTIVVYSDDNSTESFSVSYSGIDGNDANSYYIETNQEEILRFREGEGYLYSPQTFTFKIYKNPKQDSDEQIAISDNSYKLEYYGEGEFQEITDKTIVKLGFMQEVGDEIENQAEVLENQLTDPYTVYFSVSSFYETYTEDIENSQIFRFSYLINDEIAAIKIIQMRNGVTEDMATFGLYAGGFNAAIQETKLNFSADGLAITNGGIKIYKKDQYYYEITNDIIPSTDKAYYIKENDDYKRAENLEESGFDPNIIYYERKENESVFYADTDGNLTLTGTIYATNGSFSGSLYSTDAEIGGFKIDDSKIYVPVKNENQDDDFTDSPLYLESSGHIYAKNITIGTGAVIEDFISLGDAKLFNPVLERNDGLILSAGGISLKEDGYLKLGEIEFFGGDGSSNSYIKCEPVGALANWQINGDGTAYFNEITVNKATIQNSVLEIGTVQSVGSLILFKDSWKIEEVLSSGYKLNSIHSLQVGDSIMACKNGQVIYYKIAEGSQEDIIFLNSGTLFAGDIITKVGKNGDYLISILGDTNNKFNFSSGNSLTISQALIGNTGDPSFDKKLVLGDLSGVGYSDFGLYADNVYLKGTLTTEVGQSSYAGVNTLNGTTAEKFGETDKSKIVFWAGATSNSDEAIQTSNFHVTEQGSIYASQGIFEGAIISKSTIKGASLHAAEIYGEDLNGDSTALKIYECAKGIQFMKARGENTVQLQIDNTGFSKDEIYFINLTGTNEINFLGTSSKYRNLNSNSDSCSFIDSDSLSFGVINGEEYSSNWEIQNNNASSTLQFVNINSTIFGLANQEVRSYQNFYADNNITFGEKLEYRKALNNGNIVGYDLYVR